MADMKVADPQGKWFINTGLHRMHDPESNTYFEPGVPTKATPTSWILGGEDKEKQPGQVVIVQVDDPTEPETARRAEAIMAEAKIQKHGATPEPKPVK